MLLQMADDFTDKIERVYSASPRIYEKRGPFEGIDQIRERLEKRYIDDGSFRTSKGSMYYRRRRSSMVIGNVKQARGYSVETDFDKMESDRSGNVKLIELINIIKKNNWVQRYPWENVSGLFQIVASDVRYTVSLEGFLQLLFWQRKLADDQ